jgi:hypothetical protein
MSQFDTVIAPIEAMKDEKHNLKAEGGRLAAALSLAKTPGGKAICELYTRCGQSDYIGEAITQWEHGLQAAYMATAAGMPEEVVIAALLHGIVTCCLLSSPSTPQRKYLTDLLLFDRLCFRYWPPCSVR